MIRMPPQEPIRAAIYLRMSLDRELGIDRQREDCWALCKKLGWTAVEYIDNDKSATKKNVIRHAYELMCKDIEAGEIDAIITWRSDRLYRMLRDLLPLIDLIQGEQKRGRRIAIETCRTGLIDLTTDSGRMNAKILAAVSENEGEVRLDRQSRALEQLAASGRGWGAPAFGFNGDHRNPKLVPKEAALIRKAYKDFQAGATLYSIAMEWNRAGYRTRPNKARPTGNAWNSTTVGRLLKNPRNAGLRSFRGSVIGKGDWPAIVDESTWEAACYIMGDPKRRTSHLYKRTQLLGGILRCGVCGKGMGTGKNSRGQAVYKCKNYGDCSGGPVRRVEEVDGWVREVMIKRLETGDWVANTEAEQENADALYEEAATIRTRMDSLANDFAEGELTASQLRIVTEKLQSKLADVETRLSRLSGTTVFKGLLGVKDIAAYWDGPKDEDPTRRIEKQRALILALCDEIVIQPLGVVGRAANNVPRGTGFEVHWHDPEYVRDGRQLR